MNLHICIVSDQILPSLIPALMEAPKHVVLVASLAMEQRAKRLLVLLQERGIGGEIRKAAPEVGLNEIRAYAGKLAEDLRQKYADANFTLNATGGTKLMTLGFVDAFGKIGARIIYTDTGHRRIEQLAPQAEALPLRDVLDVPAYLAAQGLEFREADSDRAETRGTIEGRKKLTQQWGKQVAALQSAFTALNGALAQARDEARRRGQQLDQLQVTLKKRPWRELCQILKDANSSNLLNWQSGSSEFQVNADEAVRYLHGGWLEEYAYLCASAAQPYDRRMGVHIAGSPGDRDKNEFDLLVAHGNELLFIECKTANYAYAQAEANEVAYKIDSLGRHVRGLFGATWLLCAIEPPRALLDRAKEYRIKVVGPAELPKLQSMIEAWVNRGGT